MCVCVCVCVYSPNFLMLHEFWAPERDLELYGNRIPEYVPKVKNYFKKSPKLKSKLKCGNFFLIFGNFFPKMQGPCNQFFFFPTLFEISPTKKGWPDPFFEVIKYFSNKCQLAVVGMVFAWLSCEKATTICTWVY